MADRNYAQPYRNFRFKLEIDGLEAGGFSEVSGIDASVDVVEYREGTDTRLTPRKLPGLTKLGNVTFKKGTTDSLILFDWVNKLTLGNEILTRKTVTLTAQGEDGNDVASWQFLDAWPVKYTGPDFNATASEIAIESIEICFEEMKRTK